MASSLSPLPPLISPSLQFFVSGLWYPSLEYILPKARSLGNSVCVAFSCFGEGEKCGEGGYMCRY
ncbi:unnamed protein product [Periconia digitata]|uniref:Uncharacterized protein n=1 Tax=Periconia digitata TaxID=1303443 RepID=A0A9W4UGR9_9PLEO|nr:unnamed protein product [Periconia digitata]